MRAPCSSKILSRSRAWVSSLMAYERPEQPPPWTPTRKPPISGDTPSFSSRARIFSAARSVRWIFAIFGLATSVAIFKCSKRLAASTLPGRGAGCCALQRGQQLPPYESLVRRLFVDRDFNAVLFLPVTDGGLD